MGLFDAISGLITGSVGNNMDNNEDDVLKVKQNLHKAGYFDTFNEDPEPHGFVTRKMDEGIRIYQKDNGLKVDGILHPRGETERGLFHTITGQILEPLFDETDGFDEGTVGFGGNVSGTFGTNPFGRKNSFDDVALYAMSQTNKGEPAQPVSAPPAPPAKPETPPVNLITAQVVQNANNPDTPPPIPPRKPPLLSNADEKDAAKFVKEQEVSVEHLYKDTRGNMTIGVGHLVTSLDEAKNLPLYVHDKDNRPMRPATEAEIEKIFQQVESKNHGQKVVAESYDPKNNPGMQNIRLRKEDEDSLFKLDLRHKAQDLQRNWKNFDSFPPQLQQAMLDVHFNTGSLTPQKWKKLDTAIKSKDKPAIIREIHRDTPHEQRNVDTQNLLKSMDMSQWY